MKAWTQFWFTPAPASTLGLCRALFFVGVCLWQIPLGYSSWGEYSSVWWMPTPLFHIFRIPLLSSTGLAVVETVWKVSLVLGAIGLFTRGATIVAFVLGTYLLGLPHNFGQTQHFDALVVFVLGALALSRAGDAWSIDALIAAIKGRSPARPAESAEYGWPIRFVWVAMALIFCAAGLSKLRHSGLDWIFSDNLAMLLRRQQYHLSDGEPLTTWGLTVASHPALAKLMAGFAVGLETSFPLTLFSRTARMLLVPAALSFLIGIRVLMGPTFEQFMICFVFWVPWHDVAAAVRARTGQREPARVVLYDADCSVCLGWTAALTRLDLLQRLRFAAVGTDWDRVSARYATLDRDVCASDLHVITPRGELLRGLEANRSLARVLPLGWLLLPILYLPGVSVLIRRAHLIPAPHRNASSLPLAGTGTTTASPPRS